MNKLDGTWIYRSLRGSMAPPSPVVPWAPQGRLEVATDGSGKVEGKLQFPALPGLVLTIDGSMTPSVAAGPAQLPEGVKLTGQASLPDGRHPVYDLVGYLVVDGTRSAIVGTVWAVSDDLAGEPDGTSGPFILFPAG